MNYSELSIKELKAIAQAKGIEVAGDKRSKATWVLALETSAIVEAVESPFELVIKSDPIASPPPALEPNTQSLKPNPQVSEQTVPTQQRGASIVALIVVLAFSVGLLIIKMGLTSFGFLIPLALGLWRYLVPDPKHQDSTGSRSSIPLNQVLIN
jgi:hypothetical protein